MTTNTRTEYSQSGRVASLVLPPFVLTIALWFVSQNEIQMVQGAVALMLTCFPWWGYQVWKRSRTADFPLLTAVAAVYWVYFALPLFIGDVSPVGLAAIGGFLPGAAVTQALLMVLLGVICL